MLKDFRTRLSNFIAPKDGDRVQQTVRENDNTFFIGDNASGLYRDRFEYDRATILSECLRAWRVSPIARRIVKLYTEFMIGAGLSIKSDHTATQKFLQDWWNHPLNKLSEQIPQWCDERTRSGNLFFLISPMPDGMSFVRAVPAELIKEIQTAENDIMQEKYYIPVIQEAGTWPAYDPTMPILEDGEGSAFMLHYTTNKPVGVIWGEPDLAPLLPWIGRYSTWLEDRVRLNHFRSAFMYVIEGNYQSEAERKTREMELNSKPPKSGSVLVVNRQNGEAWGILAQQLDAFDASLDGLSLKKMIALGAEIPLHYLAEPESSTSTTADASGTPTFRGLQQKQTEFITMIKDLATIAVRIRKEVDRRVNPEAVIEIEKPDITERDNSNLALAASRIEPVAADLFDREMIEAEEMLRLTYRMAGEVYETEGKVEGKRRPLKPAEGATPTSDIKKEPDPQDDKEPQ